MAMSPDDLRNKTFTIVGNAYTTRGIMFEILAP